MAQPNENMEKNTAETGKKEAGATKDSTGAKGKKKSKLRREHIVIGALVLVLAGVLTYFLWPAGGDEVPVADPTPPLGGRGTVAVPENIEQIMREKSEPPPGGHYIVTMNNVWTFDRWNAPSGDAYVENEARNEYTVYFDLTLDDDDGRLVYSSPYIPIGATLTGFALDESVPAGEHTATMVYYLVDENEDAIANLPVRVTLSILG